MVGTSRETSSLDVDDTQPGGGGTGVSFDWGLAIALGLGAAGYFAGYPIGPALTLPEACISLVIAAVMVVQGEALRRGNGVAWRIQIGFHSLLVLYGLASIFPTLEAFQQGRFDLLYTLVLRLVLTLGVSPAEIWLLLRPGSRRWYGIVSPQAARQRHNSGWLIGVIVWAVVGGVAQAFAP